MPQAPFTFAARTVECQKTCFLRSEWPSSGDSVPPQYIQWSQCIPTEHLPSPESRVPRVLKIDMLSLVFLEEVRNRNSVYKPARGLTYCIMHCASLEAELGMLCKPPIIVGTLRRDVFIPRRLRRRLLWSHRVIGTCALSPRQKGKWNQDLDSTPYRVHHTIYIPILISDGPFDL